MHNPLFMSNFQPPAQKVSLIPINQNRILSNKSLHWDKLSKYHDCAQFSGNRIHTEV